MKEFQVIQEEDDQYGGEGGAQEPPQEKRIRWQSWGINHDDYDDHDGDYDWFGIMKISQYFRPGARLPTATSDGACKASTQVKKKYHHDHHHPIIMIDHHHLIIMIIIMIMIRILKILSRVRLPPHASPPPWGGKAVQGCHSPTDGWVSFHFTFLMVWNTSYFKLPIKSWYINDFLLG